jgi:uncharacterized membrane protein YbhN (UPF0104 family)
MRRLGRIPTPAIFAASVVLALIVLWWQGQIKEILDVVGDAAPGPLLLAAPIYVASLWLLCYRWHVLVRMAQGWSDLPRASEAFLTSVVINYAAPVGLAVPSRAALTKRALGLDAHATGTIALWEIGADVIVLGLGTVLWMLMAEGSMTAVSGELESSASRYLIVIGAAIVVGFLGAVLLLRTPRRRRQFAGLVSRIILAPKERPLEAAAALAVTLVYWIVQGVVLGLLVHAMHVDTSFEFILGLTSLPILVGMLSPIPGGAVVREALMYVVARLADVPGGEVVAAAVIYRMALFGAIPILYALTRLWISRRDGDHPEIARSPKSVHSTRA